MSDSVWPYGLLSRQPSLSMGFSRQEYWSGLPCLPSGESFWPQNRTTSLRCELTLASRFFTTSTTWVCVYIYICIYICTYRYFYIHKKKFWRDTSKMLRILQKCVEIKRGKQCFTFTLLCQLFFLSLIFCESVVKSMKKRSGSYIFFAGSNFATKEHWMSLAFIIIIVFRYVSALR